MPSRVAPFPPSSLNAYCPPCPAAVGGAAQLAFAPTHRVKPQFPLQLPPPPRWHDTPGSARGSGHEAVASGPSVQTEGVRHPGRVRTGLCDAHPFVCPRFLRAHRLSSGYRGRSGR
eukprot:scaffold625_cov420-Prasinococcus_capsulatus_cf.AAC.45